jgi:chromosome partitioning protein
MTAVVRREMTMRTVAMAATKGGVGKTTLTAALSVRAAAERARVAMIDLDPQGSLTRWWELRGEVDNPRLIRGVDTVHEAVELLRMDGWEWLFIDTPPAMLTIIDPAIRSADLVLIPVRPSALDVMAVDPIVELCKEHDKRFGFLLNAAEPRSRLTETAVKYLEHEGDVLDQHVNYRQPYIAAMTAGKTGPEVERDGKAREEVDGLWRNVKKLAGSKLVVAK